MRLPRRFVRVDKVGRTVALMNKKTGHLKGRVKVPGKGDTTRVIRVRRNVDLNKDGKPEYYGGSILGRTKKIVVKGSKRARSYIRKI
jgi:hypothetical protein